MLEPDGRAALTEQLRPPSGYTLIHAVGTTFTLDLTSALTVPLSFAGHQLRETEDPIAILDAVRRAAELVDVFGQAGQISVPRQASDLVAFLEPMVHPVLPPTRGSLFHPKIWILEFGRDEERAYRLLCSSRNLTSDRSWDVMVRLDSDSSRSADSSALQDLLLALPAMAVTPLAADRIIRLRSLAARVKSLAWESPTDIREVQLHCLGVRRPPTMDFGGKRHFVISPFLSDDGIARVTRRAKEKVRVLSRVESLESLTPDTLSQIEGFVLDDAARDPDESADDALVGLHAKVVGLDRIDGSHLFIGSANATAAALDGNVEFMVELIGPQPRVGVDVLFGDTAALRNLVVPYAATGGRQPTESEQADYALEVALRQFAGLRFRNTIRDDSDGTFAIDIELLEAAFAGDGITATVQLLTRPGNSAPMPDRAGEPVTFSSLPLTDLTPFTVIRVRDSRGEERSTVVRAELAGDLPHRHDAVLARQIDSPQKFLQFLLLLLSLGGMGEHGLVSDGGAGLGDWSGDGSGVFESLVKALGARAGSLDVLARLVDRLKADNPAVLPEGFDDLWESVWAAHGSLMGSAS